MGKSCWLQGTFGPVDQGSRAVVKEVRGYPMVMNSLVRLRYDDPLCPRIDLSLRGAVRVDEARRRLSSGQREKLLQLLFAQAVKPKYGEGQADLVASLIIRLERARSDRALRKAREDRVPRLIGVSRKTSGGSLAGDKHKRRISSAARVEQEATDAIVYAAGTLQAAMARSVRVTNRIEAEMRSFSRNLTSIQDGYLLDLVAACKRARARIIVGAGRDEGRALLSTAHHLGAIWLKSTGVDPIQSTGTRAGSFAHFVNVVLDMAGVKEADRSNIIRSVIRQRKARRGEIARQYSDQDEASDNSYPFRRRK